MATKSLSLAMLFVTTIAVATEPETRQNAPGIECQQAENDFIVRLAEFKSGQSRAMVVVQANKRLLLASLADGLPNTAIEYDQRAATIESYAKRNLELRTGTRQEITLAKSARIDAMLKHLLMQTET